ncbi:MAG: Ig-like domain-containing protein [Oscillospiraceae bacterium]
MGRKKVVLLVAVSVIAAALLAAGFYLIFKQNADSVLAVKPEEDKIIISASSLGKTEISVGDTVNLSFEYKGETLGGNDVKYSITAPPDCLEEVDGKHIIVGAGDIAVEASHAENPKISGKAIISISEAVDGGDATAVKKSGFTSPIDYDFEEQLDKFPQGYRVFLRELHRQYPEWKFEALVMGKDFFDEIQAKKESFELPKSLSNGKDPAHAPLYAVAYFMDPRNFLSERAVFQFEQLPEDGAFSGLSGLKSTRYFRCFYADNKKLYEGASQAYEAYEAYKKSSSLENARTFAIPVFENMSVYKKSIVAFFPNEKLTASAFAPIYIRKGPASFYAPLSGQIGVGTALTLLSAVGTDAERWDFWLRNPHWYEVEAEVMGKTVRGYVSSEYVEIDSAKKLLIGDTSLCDAIANPSKHEDIMRYESSDERVAEVSKNGTIKAIGEGSANILAYTSTGAFFQYKVQVVAK